MRVEHCVTRTKFDVGTRFLCKYSVIRTLYSNIHLHIISSNYRLITLRADLVIVLGNSSKVMGALKNILIGVLIISIITFVALFGRLPAFR